MFRIRNTYLVKTWYILKLCNFLVNPNPPDLNFFFILTDVEGPITSTNKDVLSFSGERAPKTKRLVPSNRVDNSISDLSISDMTELKENGDVENIKIIAKISALMTHYHTLLKINR